MPATLVSLKLFLFTPKGKNGLHSTPVTARVNEAVAEKVVRAFFSGPIDKVMGHLDPATVQAIHCAKIDPADAVNGEVGVDSETLQKYAPDLAE